MTFDCGINFQDVRKELLFWYIPSEKIGQNFHPSESSFFVINYQQWTGRSAFRPFLALPDHLGGLGGPGGVMGGLKTLKMTLSLGDHFRP